MYLIVGCQSVICILLLLRLLEKSAYNQVLEELSKVLRMALIRDYLFFFGLVFLNLASDFFVVFFIFLQVQCLIIAWRALQYTNRVYVFTEITLELVNDIIEKSKEREGV